MAEISLNIQRVKEFIRSNKQNITQLNEEIVVDTSENTCISSFVQHINEEIARLNSELARYIADVARFNGEIAANTGAIATATKEITRLKEQDIASNREIADLLHENVRLGGEITAILNIYPS